VLDIARQTIFWKESAQEDWAVAQELVLHERTRHGLFFAHLALEKALKACVVRRTGELAPRIHNLVRLAELAQIQLSPDQLDLLADMNVFNLEGRYPEVLAPLPSQAEAAEVMDSVGEVLAWLMNL
jgi:HEPN domain-containing protein